MDALLQTGAADSRDRRARSGTALPES